VIKSDWYQDRWGDQFQILKSADAKRLFENDRNGRRLASSVTSRATGEGGDRLVVDDPHNARVSENENKRKEVIEWWTQTMSSRVNTADAVKVITAQRTHHADVIGHAWAEMLAGGEQYELLILPMEYDPRLYGNGFDLGPEDDEPEDDDETEEDEDRPLTLADFEEDNSPKPIQLIPVVNGLGFRDPRTEKGELLVPEQWPRSFIEIQKRNMTEYKYAGQYQQSPSPAEGGKFKDEYWGTYNYNALWHQGLRPSMIFVDSAYGVEDGDPTAVATWGVLGGRLFVMAAYELELELPDLRRRLRDIHAKWKVPFMIEKKATGISLIQDLRRGGDSDALPALPVMEFIPDGMSKEERAFSCVPYVAGGLVYLPEGADWVDDFKRQHKQFPKGAHDDLVDTTAMAITWLAKHTNEIADLLNRPQPAPYGAGMASSAGLVGGLPGGSRNGSSNQTPYWKK
jgi:predicted phage terminase large subunit-like protein